jgi:hypothetical protein
MGTTLIKTKICTKCQLEKELSEFLFRFPRQSYYSRCKLCCTEDAKNYQKLHPIETKARHKEYVQKNKAKIKIRMRKYRLAHKEEYRARDKKCYYKNKEKMLIKNRKYHETHKEHHRLYHKKYQNENKETIALAKKEYRAKNKDKINSHRKFKLDTDINFKIATALRTRISNAIKYGYKAGSAVRDLGCSIEEFKNYIAAKFKPGMTWKNWGLYTWHLDHIRPLASFNISNREEFVVAVHYTNHQPLWATTAIAREHGDFESIGNLDKGDKILPVGI